MAEDTNSCFVLDTSALLALWNDEEPGSINFGDPFSATSTAIFNNFALAK